MRIHLGDTSRPNLMRLTSALLLSMSLVSQAKFVSAAEKSPVRISIQSPAGRSRSQAPQTLEVTLTNQLNVLIEGELELSIYVGRQLVQKYRSDPMALGQDPHRFRLMIPPIPQHNEQVAVTAVGKFVSGRQTFELDDQDIVVPPHWKRWFVLAISRPEEEAAHRDRFSIEAALSLERFNSVQGDATLTDLLTTPAVITPALLPATSAGYASYDVVLLEDGGFSQLRDGQLLALASWVEAGGSVVIRPTGAIKNGHVEFLNRVAGAPADAPQYRLSERGRIEPESPAFESPVARYYAGLGRAVVVHRPHDGDEDFRSDDWVETAMFVWKVKAEQRQWIRDTGRWNFALQRQPQSMGWQGPRPFAPVDQPLEGPLRSLLIPKKVQGLPFWVVVSILAVFLLLIAPGDYFLLGALRARRFTWVSMTALSLAFTFGTVRITENVMGTTDYRKAIVFADLGQEGTPLRTSRYELLFTATQKAMTARFQNEIHVGIDDRITRPEIGMPGGSMAGGQWVADDENAPQAGLAPDLPEYRGRMPRDFEVYQQMRQWSPLVTRQTQFGGTVELPKLDWNGLEHTSWETAEGRGALRDAIRSVEPEGQIYLFHGNHLFDVIAGSQSNLMQDKGSSAMPPMAGAYFPVAPGTRGRNIYTTPQGTFQYIKYESIANGSQPRDLFKDLIVQASAAMPMGLFSIVSQVSPTGADGVEDLALIDPTDDEQWLLVVVVPRGEDQIVCRRIYRRPH